MRLGTPAVTTRGMKEAEMKALAEIIGETLGNGEDPAAMQRLKGKVRQLSDTFPIYGV
jgi:glycine hydroxymethyltransferase